MLTYEHMFIYSCVSGAHMLGPLVTTPEPPTQPETCAEVCVDKSRVAAARRRLLSQEAATTLADTFRVLGDVTRVRMLDALSAGELCVCDLATLLGLSDSAVSHQLRLLRNLRLVRSRRDGRLIYYALDDQHIVHLFEQGLRHVEETRPGAGDDPMGAHRTRPVSAAKE